MSASTVSTTRPARKLIARLSIAVAATLAAGAAATTLGMAPASAATTTNWIMTGWNIHQLDQLKPAIASHFFNTPGSYATGPNAATSPVSDGFTTSGVLAYTSYAQFAADIASHAIAPTYSWVMYDPEYWSATPLNEQQNPAQYMQEFGQLAHANGLKVIRPPAATWAWSPAPPARKTPGENLDHWFLRCNIPGAAAADADMVVSRTRSTPPTPPNSTSFTATPAPRPRPPTPRPSPRPQSLHHLRHRHPDGHRRQIRPRRRHLHQRHHVNHQQDQVLPLPHAGRRLLTQATLAWCPAALLRGTRLSGVRARGPIR